MFGGIVGFADIPWRHQGKLVHLHSQKLWKMVMDN